MQILFNALSSNYGVLTHKLPVFFHGKAISLLEHIPLNQKISETTKRIVLIASLILGIVLVSIWAIKHLCRVKVNSAGNSQMSPDRLAIHLVKKELQDGNPFGLAGYQQAASAKVFITIIHGEQRWTEKLIVQKKDTSINQELVNQWIEAQLNSVRVKWEFKEWQFNENQQMQVYSGVILKDERQFRNQNMFENAYMYATVYQGKLSDYLVGGTTRITENAFSESFPRLVGLEEGTRHINEQGELI